MIVPQREHGLVMHADSDKLENNVGLTVSDDLLGFE